MTRVPIGIRLGIAFGVLVSILIGIGWLGLSRMGKVNADLNSVFDRHWAKVQLARDAAYYTNLNNRLTMEMFLLDRKEEIPRLVALRTANSNKMQADLKAIEAGIESDQERERVAAIVEMRVPYFASYNQAVHLLVTGKPDEARQMLATVTMPMLSEYHNRWNAFVLFQEAQMDQARDQSKANYAATRRLASLLILLGIVVAIGIAAFITRTLVEETTEREQSKMEIRKLNEGLEQKVAERTQKLARLAAVVESSDDAIVGATGEGIVLSWNNAAERIYGYSAAEMIGTSANVLVPADRQGEIQELLERLRRGEKVVQFETIRRRKDGRQIPVAVTLSPIRDPNGGTAGVAAIARDITERKRMEETLRQAQKMETVGRLAGGVAHDFNNLLAVILGYSELILDQVGDKEPLRKNTEQIKKAGNRASTLTRQLLAFSRQQVLETRVLNLNTIIEDMASMFSRLIGEDIELCTWLNPALGNVNADQGQIEQVIMNLAVNARDAMPGGGKLVIQTANVQVNETYALQHPPMVAGDYVMLVVSDSGTGMDAQTQAHIFEPFFTTKGPSQGTGLGLATVYGVVKQSGGYIWVHSEPGLGSVFSIYLPLVHAKVSPIRPSDSIAGLSRESQIVLLVEDEDSLRTLTRIQLEQNGYTVLEADGGARALEIALHYDGPIHLLLTDVVMPGINGIKLAEKLISIRPQTRVVYMSGYAGFAGPRHADADATVLAKPFTREALLCKLHEVLESELTSS